MITAKQSKEVSVRVLNDIGILAELTKIVAEKGINILAAAAWTEDENKGVIHLVTDDNLRACDALRAHEYNPEEVSSILVELHHKPGLLSTVCQKVGETGIGIKYFYTSSPIYDDECLMILKTDNDEKALVALNEKELKLRLSA